MRPSLNACDLLVVRSLPLFTETNRYRPLRRLGRALPGHRPSRSQARQHSGRYERRGAVARFRTGKPRRSHNSHQRRRGPGRHLADMSPEQCCDGVASPASELCALGCMMFQLLTGRLPFGRSPTQMLQGRLTRPRPRVRGRARAARKALQNALHRSSGNCHRWRCLEAARDLGAWTEELADEADALREQHGFAMASGWGPWRPAG